MILSSEIEKLSAHLALTSCGAVSEIMMPKLEKYGITCFNYYKTYSDNSVIRLSTHAKWTEHYLIKNYLSTHTVPVTYLSKNKNYYIWLIEDCPEILSDACHHFNIANGITIAIKQGNCIEFFGFGSTRDNISIVNNFYLNNLDLLENYCYFFKEQACGLLKKYEKDKIIKDKFDSVSLIPQHKLMTIPPTRRPKLSPRQNFCADLLIQGMTTKEIAETLNLSPRTVETHINILKTKLRCRNKSALIVKLIES